MTALGALAGEGVLVPDLPAGAGDADVAVPISTLGTDANPTTFNPDLSSLALQALAAVPVLVIGTDAPLSVPDLLIAAPVDAVLAIPDLAGLANDAGDAIVVGVGGTGGEAVSVVEDRVALALSAGTSHQHEVTVGSVVEGRGGSHGELIRQQR